MKTRLLLTTVATLTLSAANVMGSEFLGVGEAQDYVASCEEDSANLTELARERADGEANRHCQGMFAVRSSEYVESNNCRFVRWDQYAPYLRRVISHAIYRCVARPFGVADGQERSLR